jgi:quinol monooxygenase YgiN
MRSYLLVLSALLAASPAFAQSAAPGAGDATRVAVAYVEVLPSATATMTSAFKQYRDASRREDGFVRFELLEQTDRAGHFVVLESWRDPAAFDAHAAAPAAKAFADAIKAIRTSGYDQRPYKNLSIAAPRGNAGNGAVHVVTHVDVTPPGDASALLRRLADASRQESGSVRFDVFQHAMRANHYTVVETWASKQAHEAHVAAAHTRTYRDDLQPMSGSPLDERVLRSIE